MINFDKYVERRGNYSVRWDSSAIGTGQDELLPFWVADTDFKAPEQVTQALTDYINHGVYSYSPWPKDLSENFALWQKNRNDFEIDQSFITSVPGVFSGVSSAIQAFTEKGDGILCNTPIYSPFHLTINSNQRRMIEVPLKQAGNRFELDFDEIEKRAKETKLWLFCNPHNPVGRCFTEQELRRVAEICLRNKIILVSDEIHGDIVYSGYKHIPIASLGKEILNNTITLASPSKTFSLAGFATAFAIIANEDMRSKFSQVCYVNHLSVSVAGLIAANAAYKHGTEYCDSLRAYLEANRDFVVGYINQNIPKIRPITTEGTYLMWLDCSGTGCVNDELYQLMKKSRVLLSDGMQYLDHTGYFMRFNFASCREVLAKGLERMKDGLMGL